MSNRTLGLSMMVAGGVMILLGAVCWPRMVEPTTAKDELDTSLPWVARCGAPPPGYLVATNHAGRYAIIHQGSGAVLYGSVSTSRQAAINRAWQFVMWQANKANQPQPQPETWTPEAR